MRKVGALGTVASLFAAGLSIAVAAPASANGCSAIFDTGDGSQGSPFEISDDTDLTALKENTVCWASNYHFRQTANINMGGTTWENHAIGYANGPTPFAGTYDGDGNEITGLTIDFTGDESSGFDSGNYAGLFGYLTGTVSNLGFTGNVTATGDFVGGLVGDLGTGAAAVTNSYATGNVEGYRNVGGLIGGTNLSSISSSYATGDTTGQERVGGLIGQLISATVTDSFSTGTVTGNGNDAGGLIGYNDGGSVTASYSSSSVSTTGDNVGGLVGSGYSSSRVSVSYATGAVSGDSNVGGLIGYNDQSSIVRSYAIGSVQGQGNAGGLIGQNVREDITTPSFWDVDTSGLSSGAGSNSPGYQINAVGATTEEMQTLSTFEDAGWDIADSWSSSYRWGTCEGSGYPYLIWQYTSNSEACDGGGGSTPATSSGTATYTFTFLTSGGGVCFVDDNVAAGAYALPTSQVACTPEGTELVGWKVRGQVGAFSDGGIVTASGDQTFTAVAKDPTLEVTFDPNVGLETACLLAGSDVESDQRAVEVTLPRGGVIGDVDICAPAGHTLAGWTDRPTTDGPYTPVDGASLLTTGMEIPATWHHDPNPVNSIRLYAVWNPAS